MISGVSRTHLEKETLIVWAGIPAVVFGKDHRVKHILNSPSIVIPFTTKYRSFFVDVCIKSTVKKATRPHERSTDKPGRLRLDGKMPPLPVMTTAEEAMPELPPMANPEVIQEMTRTSGSNG